MPVCKQFEFISFPEILIQTQTNMLETDYYSFIICLYTKTLISEQHTKSAAFVKVALMAPPCVIFQYCSRADETEN